MSRDQGVMSCGDLSENGDYHIAPASPYNEAGARTGSTPDPGGKGSRLECTRACIPNGGSAHATDQGWGGLPGCAAGHRQPSRGHIGGSRRRLVHGLPRSEEHTSELQSRPHLVCRLLLEKKKKKKH